MKKMKIAMIVSAVVVAAGLALALVGLLVMRFDFKRFDLSRYRSITHEIGEDFNQILIDVDTADVTFGVSQDGVCRVACFEDESRLHSVNVQNGTLQIVATKGKWYHQIGVYRQSPTVTVSLPKTAYDALELHTDTGDVTLPRELSFTGATVESDTGEVSVQAAVSGTLSVATDTGEIEITGVSPERLHVKSGTGDVELTAIRCGELLLESDTGDVELTDLVATGTVSITTSTGDVDLDACDAASISICTDTGDVWGRLLSDKTFVTKTDTGDVDVPSGTSGGVCEVETDTGDIEFEIANGT